ncbi:hypothetical protein CWI38_0187p0040 [Hamiltosporidium tvaerminnensis]|uniref:Golgin subfamily A member 7/ERF4 domain-containing protein n=2 Tax=Hamiltosporidium TaxID=1176354 RepID=A0A4Q9LDH4_9MICR|nr:hypothetical protein CWI39_1415p0020 [Hamiltosporidium magnivora]TBU03908.1 hypothetical protein CWI36_0842p0020 [Hamiltosporidium magnivora]TBU04774.1 hypothetical protein CWI37_0090p0070 [Hamiltosporidium tvaerminnensis]TBU05596.1 hypothetical protein CWI36_0614p0020 [Hamiltosporidium magnivora]TBU19846.1 hypothetical protein CWI38_0187p0040 [Hamiltosporidium tvaerminnensis]
MEVFYIPRDPRTRKIRFLTGIPDKIKRRISETDWNNIITEINEKLVTKISIISILSNLLIIPILFFNNRNLDKEIINYLESKNTVLRKRGIYICSPSITQYLELKVIVY